METTNKPEKTLAFINDKSPILDAVCNDLTNLGFEVLYRSEHIEDGITDQDQKLGTRQKFGII